MARDLNLLIPQMREKWQLMDAQLLREGFPFRVYMTRRTPWEQARFYRQDKTTERIEEKMRNLERAGAPLMAHVLNVVGPQYGRRVTNALPGDSWHQHSQAWDACHLLDLDDDGILDYNWDTSHAAWARYHELALHHGLSPGPKWDKVHLQFQPVSAPHRMMPWQEIDMNMKFYYGEDEHA